MLRSCYPTIDVSIDVLTGGVDTTGSLRCSSFSTRFVPLDGLCLVSSFAGGQRRQSPAV